MLQRSRTSYSRAFDVVRRLVRKELDRPKGLFVAPADSRHLHDPAGADPGLADGLRGLLRPQRPGDVPTVADLVIPCHEGDLALSLKLAADLAVQRLLVGFHRQSASAWISTPSRSSSPSSCRSTARLWFSPVA
jgi:hypothetical protein